MKIKIYKDKTYNIFFEKGDYVKVKSNPKFPKPASKEGTWGKVTKSQKSMNSKIEFEKDKNKFEEYPWNLIAVDEKGNQIPEKQLFELTPIQESLSEVIDFSEWRFRRKINS